MHKKTHHGFVILFTALIASIVLAIALGIASISYRELLLSGTAKDAQFSFFAADSGAECALYWDIQEAAFTATLVTPSCGGSSVSMLTSSSPYRFSFATSPTGCAVVTIDKNDPTSTRIESLGYNVSCADLTANATNKRIVERAIRVTYGPGEAPDPNPTDEADAADATDSATRGPAAPESLTETLPPPVPVSPTTRQ